MRDDDPRDAELRDIVRDDFLGLRVQVCRSFIDDQQGRLLVERTRQKNPLLLSGKVRDAYTDGSPQSPAISSSDTP